MEIKEKQPNSERWSDRLISPKGRFNKNQNWTELRVYDERDLGIFSSKEKKMFNPIVRSISYTGSIFGKQDLKKVLIYVNERRECASLSGLVYGRVNRNYIFRFQFLSPVYF